MIKIYVVAAGKIKETYLREGIAEYTKRLSRYCDLQIKEVEDEKAPESLSLALEEKVKLKEAEKILKKIGDNSLVIVLDVKGEKTGSEGFAKKLQGFFNSGNSDITFIIGGSLGLDDSLLERASYRLSLSDMTFPHQLTRLIFLEQLYRAFKIIHGETYHK